MDSTNKDLPFALTSIYHNETVAILELPVDHLAFLKDVIAGDMSLKVKHGGSWTLVPVGDQVGLAIRSLWNIYRQMDAPTRYAYVLQQRADGLTKAVEQLFSFQERILIRDIAELERYVAFVSGRGDKWVPATVYRPVLGPVYGGFLKRLDGSLEADTKVEEI